MRIAHLISTLLLFTLVFATNIQATESDNKCNRSINNDLLDLNKQFFGGLDYAYNPKFADYLKDANVTLFKLSKRSSHSRSNIGLSKNYDSKTNTITVSFIVNTNTRLLVAGDKVYGVFLPVSLKLLVKKVYDSKTCLVRGRTSLLSYPEVVSKLSNPKFIIGLEFFNPKKLNYHWVFQHINYMSINRVIFDGMSVARKNDIKEKLPKLQGYNYHLSKRLQTQQKFQLMGVAQIKLVRKSKTTCVATVVQNRWNWKNGKAEDFISTGSVKISRADKRLVRKIKRRNRSRKIRAWFSKIFRKKEKRFKYSPIKYENLMTKACLSATNKAIQKNDDKFFNQ